MTASAPWDLAPDLPWRHFGDPVRQWAEQPTFLVGEIMFIAFAILAFVHARRCGRDHVLTWVAALVAGTANDLFFMALPLVDNFWQAQATIMLTPRLPLYIPCVYVCFMYVPTIAVSRLGLSALPRAAATGLVAALFYAPYDIVGAKFLWWTWHDTDLPIAHRILGAPIGSTMWVATFVAAFSWLLQRGIGRDASIAPRTIARALAFVALGSTPIMMLQLTVLQQLDGGVPGPIGLVTLAAIDLAVVAWAWPRRCPRARAEDRPLLAAITIYFITLAVLMLAFDPATHRSTGIHQTHGECRVEQTDITGQVRYQFLCVSDFEEDFTFDCVAAPPSGSGRWYTVCGRAHTRRELHVGALFGLAAVGIGLFGFMLRARGKRD
jgi:hypothetical protein